MAACLPKRGPQWGRVGHAGLGWAMQGWGKSCRSGVSHAGVGWGESCRGGWVIQGPDGSCSGGSCMGGGSYRGRVGVIHGWDM